ncbi:MAG: GNAT family N-acetyltransferase [Clostridiales bacterium]|nr:GNAT family N-acetyltransferase [Clostridiales bacterium]
MEVKVKEVLTKEELKDAFEVRKSVFVYEQKIPVEIELDQFEDTAKHVVGYYEGKPVVAGRMRIVDNVAKLERICVLKNYRRYGMGRIIIRKLEELAKKDNINQAKLHSQIQAVEFYKKLGYKQVSDVFMEDNIPHVVMMKSL